MTNVEVGAKTITDRWTAYQHLEERGTELLNNILFLKNIIMTFYKGLTVKNETL